MTPSRSDRAGEGGWSYAEVVIGLSVLLVLLGSLYAAGSRGFHAVAESREETAAGRVAAARLEALLSGRAAAVPGGRRVDPDPSAAVALPGVRVDEEVIAAEPGLLSVEVRVRWSGAGGVERQYRLTTLVAAGGGR